MATLMQASNEWRTRPNDERFTSLLDLDAHCRAVRESSAAKVVASRALKFAPDDADPMNRLLITGPNGRAVTPTHWSFGQLATLAGAPAGYLRTLPAAIAADNLNYGMQFSREIEDVGVLLKRDSAGNSAELRAATGPRYGRIWNADITAELVRRFGDGLSGNWRVPGEFGKAVEVTKTNTTLYASDRDMFVFLADETNRVTVKARRNGESGSLARGFFAWNSETGSQSIGVAMFLFDYVCCNRIVWGAQQFTEKRLRHTISAPERWADDVTPLLTEYANASAAPIEATIAAAQARKLDDAKAFLANRFGAKAATRYMNAFEADENRPIESLWDVATGMTAAARSIQWQDERVAIEREAGKVLDLAAA